MVRYLATLAAFALLSLAASSQATIYSISDVGQNSEIVFDSDPASINTWTVEGIDNVFRRQYFYRLGPAVAGNGEIAIGDNTLDLDSVTLIDLNGDFGTEAMTARYTDPADLFSIIITTVLTPGAIGSRQATFTEGIRINNLSNNPLNFTLFLYADYDLNESAGDDTLLFGDSRTLTQTDGSVTHEASVTVTPTHVTSSQYSQTIDLLTDGDGTTLNDVLSYGSTDFEYAFQWDLVIPAGKSFTLGNTNSIVVPEASTLTLMGVAAAGLCLARRFRRS